jgi:6-pyruvoyltetrahydropterin/6-carboxytetrahydropterin synthase
MFDSLPPHHKSMQSTKTFGHELGFSCAFRQWRAESHCRFIHGYALSFKLVFAADTLDYCGWVVDFGGLKEVREFLTAHFDHKLLVAADDPWREVLLQLCSAADTFHEQDITFDRTGAASPCADVVLVPSVGCESFARIVFDFVAQWILDAGHAPRCRLVSVEVAEHGANSAICFG